MKRAVIWVALAALPALAQPGQPAPPLASRSLRSSESASSLPDGLAGVGIQQKLDSRLPLEAKFKDEYGQEVTLGKYFQGHKPVLLAPVYYRCPMLCTQIMAGLEGALRAVSLNPGQDFEIVAFSFDPKDSPETALAKKEMYMKRYRRPDTKNGWHFLTGDEASIKPLLAAIGYGIQYDPKTDQYAHASGVMIATPQGRLSKYFYGVEYSPRDIRLGLVEASENKIGTPVDALLLYCFHYDPATGKYGAVAMNMVRFAGATFTLIGGTFLLIMFRRDFRRDKNLWRRRVETFAMGKLALFPEQASTFAPDVDHLTYFLLAVSIFFTVLIFAAIFIFAIKYRRRSEQELPGVTHTGLVLEIVWSVIPFGLTMVMFTWGASIMFKMSRPPENAMQIYVVGKQWMWKVQHMEGRREINELHVPIGRPIKLTMTSEDVIHSFYMPAFRVKMDVVPGRYGEMWFEPTKTGQYHLFCAEYCGTKHSGMIGSIYVMEPQEYQAWLSGNGGEGSVAQAGQKLFEELACTNCHKSDGTGRCPNLNGLFGSKVQLSDGRTVNMDEAYIRESILTPSAKVVAGYQPVMPTFQGLVSEENILQLVEYIKSIGPKPATGAAPETPGFAGSAPGKR